MAKYSKEQRRCAVELYVRYECCAADMVRELGYPSREASRMWHRDWLEEQRTGVPSTRGERYARYTTEQKRAAVDHYLTHGRRASRTMRRLGYPSKEVLAAWIDELAPGERHVRCLCSISCCGLGVVTFCWTSLSVWSLVSVPDGFRRRARAGCVCP